MTTLRQLCPTGLPLPDSSLVCQLSEGPVSDNWLLGSDGREYVLRVDKLASNYLKLDRRSEAEILKQVAAAGFAPALVHSDPSNGLLVTEFLPGKVWGRSDLVRAEALQKLARRLKALHSLPISAEQLDLVRRASLYAELSKTDSANQLADRFIGLLHSFEVHRDPVALCHNDLHGGNIIDAGDLLFIDWEYASIVSVWFEIACLVAQNGLTGEQAGSFLAEYFGSCSRDHKERLDNYLELYRLLEALWWHAICELAPESAKYRELLRNSLVKIS